jgi:hypothetical protein
VPSAPFGDAVLVGRSSAWIAAPTIAASSTTCCQVKRTTRQPAKHQALVAPAGRRS